MLDCSVTRVLVNQTCKHKTHEQKKWLNERVIVYLRSATQTRVIVHLRHAIQSRVIVRLRHAILSCVIIRLRHAI